MDKRDVLNIISRFKKELESLGVRVEKVILYGSFARGDYREDSDIDLLVISQDFEGKDYWERIDILSEAIYEIFEPIEAVAMTPNEFENKDSLLVDYASNGQVV